MIALASVIASPLFWPMRGARGRGSSAPKRQQKSTGSPTLPRASAACTISSQSSRHSSVDSLVSAWNYDNSIVSVYLSVGFVNLQFVTYMAAQQRQRCTSQCRTGCGCEAVPYFFPVYWGPKAPVYNRPRIYTPCPCVVPIMDRILCVVREWTDDSRRGADSTIHKIHWTKPLGHGGSPLEDCKVS